MLSANGMPLFLESFVAVFVRALARLEIV